MAAPSSMRKVQLLDARDATRPFVPAVLFRDYPLVGMDAAENLWADARTQADAAALGGGAAPLEHGHWDWRNKAAAIHAERFMLVGLECESEPQGLMAVERLPKRGRFGVPVVYVDYLETAPWNLRGIGVGPRFSGVGTVLIADAVRWSNETGLGGRVGLHSLPQAEPFYRNLGLTEFGPDPTYFDLCYFEFTETDADCWLISLGG